MACTMRSLNKLLKENGLSDNNRVTRYLGRYHLLHSLRNGYPVPYIISEDITEIKDYICNYLIAEAPV